MLRNGRLYAVQLQALCTRIAAQACRVQPIHIMKGFVQPYANPMCRNKMALCRQCVAMRSKMLALCSNVLALALWKI